ncbi:hypothetical protein EMEDMD4_160043 [Sinorhizobium medicae]|uniref:Uncharacterized protein n=1 Tax=Sinorhizobium medicae TaxID=110321 RepID=A0A508WSK4_9HYPH|nr:hypothetical protein EMEDMD4_160043 [Sinorhizobium medicae]
MPDLALPRDLAIRPTLPLRIVFGDFLLRLSRTECGFSSCMPRRDRCTALPVRLAVPFLRRKAPG